MSLTLPRLFLLAGLSSAVILILPGLIWGIDAHFSEESLGLLTYGGASAVFVSLWAFSRFEDNFGIERKLNVSATGQFESHGNFLVK
jgi:hypothetical protein